MKITFRRPVAPSALTGWERYRRGDQAEFDDHKAITLIQQSQCVADWVDVKLVAPIAEDLIHMTFRELQLLGKFFEVYERRDNVDTLIDKLAPILRDRGDHVLKPGEPQIIVGGPTK